MPNKINFKTKLPNWGTSIFTVMSKMAVEHKAINLAQGFPDFNCSDELLELVHHYQKKGFNQYAPTTGVPKLRQAISEKIENLYNHHYDVEKEITVTAGATQALYTAISSVVRAGDEVIIIEPAYDSYVPDVTSNGGVPIYVPLNQDDFSYNWNLVRKKITSKTKLIILNSPHNPTGSLITKDDMKQLEEITRNTDILVISDEVYEHITFDGGKHYSLAESEELSKRSFIISSFGKTFHTTGWKTGYCAAPEFLTNELRKMHQFIVFSSNTPIQHAYADYMQDETHYLNLPAFYQKKRDIFYEGIQRSKFKIKPCKGTYFQLLDYSKVSSMKDIEFAEYMTKEIGIAVIPLSPFYSEETGGKLIRICFAKRDEVIKKAAKILANL